MILHLMNNEKFIAPYIEFVKDHFDFEEHFFIIVGDVSEDVAKLPKYKNVFILNKSYDSKFNYFKYSKLIKPYANRAKKIILHALFSDNKNFFLYFNQHLLSKSYWVMWGGDLYVYNKPRTRLRDKLRHYIRTQVYSKMGHFITYIKDDYELAQKWYGAKGEYHECFMYPSNLYKEYDIKPKEHNTINIQLGNSADPTNNHIEVLERLKVYKDEDIKIFTPLSYGDQEHAQKVIAYGKELFADKFIPFTEFMSFEKYLEFLGDIDIAIFAHKRQQAMGNTIALLGLGKKVYLNSSTVQWFFFDIHGIKVFNVNNADLDILDEKIKVENNKKIKQLFSRERLTEDLNRIFND